MNEHIWRQGLALPTPLLPDPTRYTLTIGEASRVMQSECCKFSSHRKVQRLCRDGHIDCTKLTTSRNGQPVIEWLVNEISLRYRIAKHEPKFDDGDAIVATHPAGDAMTEENPANTPIAMATQERTGNAISLHKDAETSKMIGNDETTPEEDGVASSEEPSKAMLMIENAKLLAELEGKSALINEILDDKGFLREELRDAREGRNDVTKIAERMLEALETMALGGKLDRLPDKHTNNQASLSTKEKGGDIPPSQDDKYRV